MIKFFIYFTLFNYFIELLFVTKMTVTIKSPYQNNVGETGKIILYQSEKPLKFKAPEQYPSLNPRRLPVRPTGAPCCQAHQSLPCIRPAACRILLTADE